MATMIPPQIPGNCKSAGEKNIFNKLKDDPGTKDWVVLHSLDLANHVNQIMGEMDFLVIVPKRGILCLEVKGCGKLRVEGGRWFYGGDQNGKLESPFRQSADAMWSLKGVLKNPHLQKVLWYSAVIFPFCDFNEVPQNKDPKEWQPWQAIDRTQYKNQSISHIVMTVLDSARKHVSGQPWFNPAMEEPTRKQCSELASELRPNFEVFQPAKEAAAMLDAELISFTEEQYVALDLMSRSDRAVFTGPAGTGKTVLAVEAARRAHSNGERVRLICFNNLLGNHLKEQVSDLGDGIFAGSLGQFMREIVGPAGMPDSPSQQFWDVELPEQARNALLDDPDSDMTVDQLIIDEGQDLLKPAFLDFFDLVLERGLAYGKWRMFGDFDNQMIFPQGSLSLDGFLTGISKQGSNVSIGSLDINCRNTPRIIDSVRIFAGLKPGYKTVLRPDNQQDCKAFFYDSDDEQQALLASVLQSYREDKIRSDDTVVLSPKTDCASRRLSTPPWNQRLVPIDKWSTGHIPYTTIHRFKGLERPAVIVTDINDVGQEEAKSLLYIALTRGTARVTWLASKDVQKMLVNALTSEAGA